MSERIVGKVVHLNHKGWGFIISDKLQFTRIYFHWSQLDPSINFTELKKGDVVEFSPIEYFNPSSKESQGWRAMKIFVLDTEVTSNAPDVQREV